MTNSSYMYKAGHASQSSFHFTSKAQLLYKGVIPISPPDPNTSIVSFGLILAFF